MNLIDPEQFPPWAQLTPQQQDAELAKAMQRQREREGKAAGPIAVPGGPMPAVPRTPPNDLPQETPTPRTAPPWWQRLAAGGQPPADLPQETPKPREPVAPPNPYLPQALPPLELPERHGILNHPLAQIFTAQYPTLEKFKGQEPARNNLLGASSNLGDVLGFQNEQGLMRGRLDALSPDRIGNNMINAMAMQGHASGPGDQARFGAMAGAQQEGLKQMLEALKIQAGAAAETSRGEIEQARLRQSQGLGQQTMDLRRLEEKGKIDVERARLLQKHYELSPEALLRGGIAAGVGSGKITTPEEAQISREAMLAGAGGRPIPPEILAALPSTGGQPAVPRGAEPALKQAPGPGLAPEQEQPALDAHKTLVTRRIMDSVRAGDASPVPEQIGKIIGKFSDQELRTPEIFDALLDRMRNKYGNAFDVWTKSRQPSAISQKVFGESSPDIQQLGRLDAAYQELKGGEGRNFKKTVKERAAQGAAAGGILGTPLGPVGTGLGILGGGIGGGIGGLLEKLTGQ